MFDTRPIEGRNSWYHSDLSPEIPWDIFQQINFWDYFLRLICLGTLGHWIYKLWKWKQKRIVREVIRKDRSNIDLPLVVQKEKVQDPFEDSKLHILSPLQLAQRSLVGMCHHPFPKTLPDIPDQGPKMEEEATGRKSEEEEQDIEDSERKKKKRKVKKRR